MVVSSISYLLLGGVNLYEKQLANRLASPAHMNEFAQGVLASMFVKDAVKDRNISVLEESLPFGDLVKIVANSPESYFPIVNRYGRVSGILTINDIREVMFEDTLSDLLVAKDVATTPVVMAYWDESLKQALDKMGALGVDELPVVKRNAPEELVGMVSKQDIVNHYYEMGGV